MLNIFLFIIMLSICNYVSANDINVTLKATSEDIAIFDINGKNSTLKEGVKNKYNIMLMFSGKNNAQILYQNNIYNIKLNENINITNNIIRKKPKKITRKPSKPKSRHGKYKILFPENVPGILEYNLDINNYNLGKIQKPIAVTNDFVWIVFEKGLVIFNKEEKSVVEYQNSNYANGYIGHIINIDDENVMFSSYETFENYNQKRIANSSGIYTMSSPNNIKRIKGAIPGALFRYKNNLFYESSDRYLHLYKIEQENGTFINKDLLKKKQAKHFLENFIIAQGEIWHNCIEPINIVSHKKNQIQGLPSKAEFIKNCRYIATDGKEIWFLLPYTRNIAPIHIYDIETKKWRSKSNSDDFFKLSAQKIYLTEKYAWIDNGHNLYALNRLTNTVDYWSNDFIVKDKNTYNTLVSDIVLDKNGIWQAAQPLEKKIKIRFIPHLK